MSMASCIRDLLLSLGVNVSLKCFRFSLNASAHSVYEGGGVESNPVFCCCLAPLDLDGSNYNMTCDVTTIKRFPILPVVSPRLFSPRTFFFCFTAQESQKTLNTSLILRSCF